MPACTGVLGTSVLNHVELRVRLATTTSPPSVDAGCPISTLIPPKSRRFGLDLDLEPLHGYPPYEALMKLKD
jgi:hypothetical protein